jgi:preprotein translocase subunit SecG
MITLLTIIHVLVAVLLVVSILLQSSKGGGLAGMFGGGGGMGAVFGGRGAASFLSKVTMWLGITFAVTSIVISLLMAGGPEMRSAMQERADQQEESEFKYIIPTQEPGIGGEQPAAAGEETPAPQQQ